MTCSLLYRVLPGGALRELRLRYDFLEWLFDGHIVECRSNRRICDFQNAAKHIVASGALIVKAND